MGVKAALCHLCPREVVTTYVNKTKQIQTKSPYALSVTIPQRVVPGWRRAKLVPSLPTSQFWWVLVNLAHCRACPLGGGRQKIRGKKYTVA